VVISLIGAQPPALDQAAPPLKGERPRQHELQDQIAARQVTGVVNAEDGVHRHVEGQDCRQQARPD
jgi:hypothetical protein